jgi:ribosome-binding ATPase YchF (GTP1/OBG family)
MLLREKNCMLIGVVGAPNKGKSTFFASATLVDAQIANYPFTTITPNRGITYVRAPCPHVALGLENCNPRNSRCASGTRLVPVEMVDVPGLVPDAHSGKGLGNKFLDSIREADAVIQVVDATGKTDLQGNPCQSCDPTEEIGFLQDEIALWLADIMKRKEWKGKGVREVAESLSGLRISERMIVSSAAECGLDVSSGLPDDSGIERIARAIVKQRLPVVVACNKMDAEGASVGYEKVQAAAKAPTFPCSAAVELALRKAAEAHVINYSPGMKEFSIVGSPNERQKAALDGMQRFIAKNNGSGVQEIIDHIVYQKLGCIIVYPVEDEHRFANHKGDVLPDAYLVPKGTTAHQLASMVHTDLAKKFIGAIDAKKKLRVGADHPLENGDVIKIVAGR